MLWRERKKGGSAHPWHDAATVEAVLAGPSIRPRPTRILALALTQTFPGFPFTAAAVDDFYSRGDARTILSADGTRLGDHRVWVSAS